MLYNFSEAKPGSTGSTLVTRQNTSTTLVNFQTPSSGQTASDPTNFPSVSAPQTLDTSQTDSFNSEDDQQFFVSEEQNTAAVTTKHQNTVELYQKPEREENNTMQTNKDTRSRKVNRETVRKSQKVTDKVPYNLKHHVYNAPTRSREALKELYSRYNLKSKDGQYVKTNQAKTNTSEKHKTVITKQTAVDSIQKSNPAKFIRHSSPIEKNSHKQTIDRTDAETKSSRFGVSRYPEMLERLEREEQQLATIHHKLKQASLCKSR